MFPIFVKAEKYFDWEIGGLGFFYEVFALSKNKEDLMKIKWKKFFIGLIHKAIILCKKKENRPPERISAAKKSVIFSLTVYEEESELLAEIKNEMVEKSYGSEPEIEILENNSIYSLTRNTAMADGRGIEYVWVLTNNRELASRLSWGNGVCGSNAIVEIISLDTDFSIKVCPPIVIGPNF